MKIVIAPDSFKGCLSAAEVSDALEEGLKRELPDASYVKIPMADGGEGTLESLVAATSGQVHQATVRGPLGEPVQACFAVTGDRGIAVIEMAQASGLPLLSPTERNPELTTTFGTGELIKAALDLGCSQFVIAIGGSATNDGGAGALQALGVKFFDGNDRELQQGGIKLLELTHIDISGIDKRLRESEILVACDVDNPLLGENGASHVYAPQKDSASS